MDNPSEPVLLYWLSFIEYFYDSSVICWHKMKCGSRGIFKTMFVRYYRINDDCRFRFMTDITEIVLSIYLFTTFLVCRLDKLLSWFSTQTSIANFRYYVFCLCNVIRQYLLPGILGIYCFLTGVPSPPAIALPKGPICSLVNQVYTSFPLMSLPPFGLHWPNVG